MRMWHRRKEREPVLIVSAFGHEIVVHTCRGCVAPAVDIFVERAARLEFDVGRQQDDTRCADIRTLTPSSCHFKATYSPGDR